MSNESKARLVVTRPYWVDLSQCPVDTVCKSKNGGAWWQFDQGCVLPAASVSGAKTGAGVIWETGLSHEPVDKVLRLRRFGGKKVSNFSQTGRWPNTAASTRIHDLDPASLDFSRCSSDSVLPLLPVGTRFQDKIGRHWTIVNNSSGPSNYNVLRDDGHVGSYGAKLMYGNQRSVRNRDADGVLHSVKLPMVNVIGKIDIKLGMLDPSASTFEDDLRKWIAMAPSDPAPSTLSIAPNGNPLYW